MVKQRSESVRQKISESVKKQHMRMGHLPGKGVVYHKIWNKHHPEDQIHPGDGYVIHHKDGNHNNNTPDNHQKMTEAAHKSLHQKGAKRTIESVRRISESQKGKKMSAEARAKMSKARKGCIPWNKGKKCPQLGTSKIGNHYRQEHVKKLRAMLKEAEL